MINKIEYIPWTRETFPNGCYIRDKRDGVIQILKCEEYEPIPVMWNETFNILEKADWKNIFNNFEHVIHLDAKGIIATAICGTRIEYQE